MLTAQGCRQRVTSSSRQRMVRTITPTNRFQPFSSTYAFSKDRVDFSTTTNVNSSSSLSSSSSSSSPKHTATPNSVLEQTTARLLAAPVGSLNEDQQWTEARYTVLDLLDLQTQESISMSFQLLDRLYREEQYILSKHAFVKEDQVENNGDENPTRITTVLAATTAKRNKNITSVPTFFDSSFLNLVVNHWRKGIISGDLRLAKLESSELHPNNIVQRLHGYVQNSNLSDATITTSFYPNVQTYGMILDAISALVEVSSSVAATSIDSSGGIASRSERDPNDLMAVVEEIVAFLVNSAKVNSHSQMDKIMPLRPNVIIFSSAMNAWVKSGHPLAPSKVEALLQQMKQLQQEYPEWENHEKSGAESSVAPNQFTYVRAIDAWAKVGNVEKVEELLQEMHEAYQETGRECIKPGFFAFNGYLTALSKQGRTREAEALLDQMNMLYESGELDQPPNVISYSTVLDGFVRSKDKNAPFHAEMLLRQMMDNYKNGQSTVSPNSISFNSVIHAHTQAGNILTAESLLREMQEIYLHTGNKEIQPTLETYSTVLSGLAKSQRRDAGERAEELLDHIKNMAKSGDLDATPDNVIYNVVLDCWAKSKFSGSYLKAQKFLTKMMEDGIQPDVISFNTVISCMATYGKIQEAEKTLEEMMRMDVKPNSISYNSVLSAYVTVVSIMKKKGENFAVEKVAFIVERMERFLQKMKQDANVRADVVTYNTVLNFYARIGDIEKATKLLEEMLAEDSIVLPDTTSMNTVINGWAISGKEDAPERAEALFERFLHGGKSPRGHLITPNTFSVNSVMTSWTRSKRPDAAQRCQKLFDLTNTATAGELRSDFVTYNILIHAWSMFSGEDAPDKAELVFYEMNKLYEEGDTRMRPNARTFGALIHAWSKSNRPNAGEKAEMYLRKLVQDASKTDDNREIPRVHEFTSSIRAWENSGDPRAPFKADEILFLSLEQVERGNRLAQPNSRLFGAFLSTLASSRVRNKPLYANRVIELMKQNDIRPNPYLVDQIKKCYGHRIVARDETKSISRTYNLTEKDN